MSLLRNIPITTYGNLRSIFRSTSLRFFTSENSNPSLNANTTHIHPTSAYYDELINEAGRSGDLETVRRLLNKRHVDGCFSTNNTFKFITNTESSLSKLDDLFHTLSQLDRGFARKSAFDTLIARLCKLDRINESLRLIEEMICRNFGSNACTFHPILSALTRKRKFEEASGLIDLMKSAGVSPDATSYNYFLTAHAVTGDLKRASDVMKQMEEEGIEADGRTYDALVLAACKGRKVEGAMVILRKMEETGIPILYSTHVHVINALINEEYYVQAMKFVMSYGGKDKKLDTESYGVLASKLLKKRRIEEAKILLEEMDRRGLAMGTQLRDAFDLNCKN